MKKKILALVQLALGVGIVSFLFFRMQRDGQLGALLEAGRSAAANWHFVVAGVFCFLTCIIACIFRWRLLLKAQGVELPFWRVTTLFFIGHFFSCFMPGATSGDLIKAYLVAKETHHRKTEVVTTVFLDRIVGLLALVLLTVTVMLVRLRFFLAYRETRFALAFTVLLFVGSIAGLAVMFGQNVFEQWSLFRRMEQRTSLGKLLAKAYKAAHVCLTHPALLWKTLSLSVLNHLALVACAFFMGLALNAGLSFGDAVTVFPTINAVSAIPLTPMGLGTREAATKFLLGVLNVPVTQAVPLSLLVYASVLFWSLVGGIFYLAYAARTRITIPADVDMDKDDAPTPARG